MQFTIIKSGRNKRTVKLASKDYKVEPTVSKEQQDDAAIETRSKRTLNRLKEKHTVSEKTGKRLTKRSCSKQSVVHKTRNQTRRSDEMFIVDEILKSNETLPGKSRNTDCRVSKKKENFLTRSGSNSESLKGDNKILESRKLELNVLERKEKVLTDKESKSESLKGDNEIDTQERLKEDNEIDTQESLKGDNEESLAEVKDESVAESSNKSKARLNEEARYNKLHPDLQELWQYLNKLNFICKICSKEYDNTVSYYNHIRCHKDVQHCKICDVFIPKEPESMEKHKAEKHGDGLIFRCLKCHQRFKSKLGLKNHFICNHADNVVRFKCQICGAQCGNLSMLTRHERIHKFENSCFICLEKIDTKEKLKQHMKDIHGYYLCTTCSLYFVDHAVLEEHVQTHFKSETDLASNTASLAGIMNTNSTSGTENGNTSNQGKNELNISDLDKNMTESSTENTQEGFLNEETTREKVEKLYIDFDCEDEILISEMTVTKHESLESKESNENQKSAIAGEIKISNETGEIQISNQAGEIKISTIADVNLISTEACENQKQCKFCGKVFKQRHALLRHMKLHNNRSDFTCEHCGKICKTDETFKRHMKLHLPNDEKPFSCDVCGKGFPTRTNLNIHSIVHNEENTYICEYCGKGFRSPRQLKIHNRSHTGEEPYQCTECNKKFRSWDMLDCHKITHKPKSVICDICGKFFAHRLRLRSHKKSHDKVGRYICIFDKLRFKSVGNLNSHYVAKHLNYAKQKGWLLHQCEHCDKVLPTKEKYHRHVRTHTGEKPFKCDKCEKSFAENGNLTAHMKIHNNDKPYKCTFCNKRFIQRRTLKKHISIHEQPADSRQEKHTEESTGYTKDQLLALSIVAGSQNYMVETGNNVPVAEKKSVQTADDRYVVIIPEGHVFQQVPELNVERTPLLPVRFSDVASVSPGQFSSSLVNFNQQEYMAFSQQSEQMTSGQFIHSNSIRLAHQSKRIPIETVQQVQKIGHITEQQVQSNEQIFIDPMSYTEHTLTTSSAL